MYSIFGDVFYILSFVCITVYGHARLWEPPSRSTMWRRGFTTPANINDNELNCGGYENLWIKYNGMCGICGDPYQQQPRENEDGGKYATGLVTRHYKTGDVATFSVDVTANHEGYFEFRLCPVDNRLRVTQECLDKHPVSVLGHSDGRYHVKPHENGIISMRVQLPKGLACERCLLQWRYRTGNRWNCDQISGKCGKGLGPQEEFYGCADISILDFRMSVPPSMSKTVNPSRLHRVAVTSKRPPAVKGIKVPLIPAKAVKKRPSKVMQIMKIKKAAPTVNKKGTRKRKLMNNLSGVLWKLLKSLTSSDADGRNIALVKWDPATRSYTTDIVYVRTNGDPVSSSRPEGFSRNNVRSNWPPVRPMVVDVELDRPEQGPVILSESPFFKTFPKQTRLEPFIKSAKNDSITCQGTNNFSKVSGIARWCTVNCRAGNCPSVMCTCKGPSVTKKKITLRKWPGNSRSRALSTSALRPQSDTRTGPLRCRGYGHFARKRQMIEWCKSNCNKGFCPKTMCICV